MFKNLFFMFLSVQFILSFESTFTVGHPDSHHFSYLLLSFMKFGII